MNMCVLMQSIVLDVTLPDKYLITPNLSNNNKEIYLLRLQQVLAAGIRLIQFRSHSLDQETYFKWAEKIFNVCESFEAQLMLNIPVVHQKMTSHLISAGIHLTSQHLMTQKVRPDCALVSASCHNRRELQQAEKLEVDFLVLSPVQKTTSHEDANILGWQKFYQLTQLTHCPVFALGGMKIEDIPKAKTNGAHGIAAIRGLWNIPNEGGCSNFGH